MKKLLSIIICIVSFVHANGQNQFIPVDEPIDAWLDQCVGDDSVLYAISPRVAIGYRQVDFTAHTWNGLFWTELPTIHANNVFYDNDHQMSTAIHNGELYVGGSFYSDGDKKRGLLKWNGSDWELVAGGIHSSRLIHDEFSVNDMVTYKDELFIVGDFNLTGGAPFSNFVSLKNQTWSQVPGKFGALKDLEIVGDQLYALGAFQTIDALAANNIVSYDGDVWSDHSLQASQKILGLGKLNSELAVFASNGIFLYNGSEYRAHNKAIEIIELESTEFKNGSLYATGVFTLDGIEGVRLIKITSDNIVSMLRNDEIEFRLSDNLKLASFQEELFLVGSFTKLAGLKTNNAVRFRPGKSVLKGQVFIDNNANCVFDDQDEVKLNALLSINSGAYYTSSNEEGKYYAYIENSKTTTVEIFPGDLELPNCNGGLRTVVTSANDSTLTENFALQMPPGEGLLRLSLTSTSGYKVKHGYEASYALECSTVDEEQYPLELTLKLDPALTNASFSIAPDLRNGKAHWTLYQGEVIEFDVTCDHNRCDMGDELVSSASVQSNTKSASVTLNQLVVSAYDPNDKQCNKYEINPKETELNYVVRFQNLGNDNARNIHIVDTIDPYLPLHHIQIKKNSHFEKYATSYRVRGHSIIWDFKNIELPPQSAVGDNLSSGYVAYKCRIGKELNVGDVISNTAYIYFDFQPAVVTNTVETNVIESEKQTAETNNYSLYPNPSDDRVTVIAHNRMIQGITLFNASGQQVLEPVMNSPQESITIFTEHLATGIYLLQVQSSISTDIVRLVVSH